MSTPDTPQDLVSVTYPGPHAAVRIPGHADPIEQGVPVDLERQVADQLVAQGWETSPRTETATAPAPRGPRLPVGAVATPPAPPETADDPSAT